MISDDGLYLGIDIGTSGVRAIALTADGSVVGKGEAAMARDKLRGPNTWWGAVEQSLDALAQSIDLGRVLAIAVDGTSGTVLAVDAAGRPVGPSLLYNDPVHDTAILRRIADEAPRESAAHGPTSALAKVITLQPISGAVHIIHQADWIAGRLTGRFDVSDENNALKTGYDPVTRTWPEWIVATGARIELLPEVREPGSPVAPVLPDIAQRFGLSSRAIVAAGTTDGCASFLATGAEQPGEGVTALGSTLVIKVLSDKPLFAPDYGLYSHRIGDRWLAGGASNTGGVVLEAFFSRGQLAAFSAAIDPDIPSGLDYYPLIKPGERFPINDPNLAPRLEPRPPDNVLFLQGLLEGIAEIEALGYDRLASLGAPRLVSVRSVGGGARNATWGEIRRRRLGVPFLPALSEEAAAGAARLAMAAARTAGLS